MDDPAILRDSRVSSRADSPYHFAMLIDSPYLARPGKKIKLSSIKTDDAGKFADKEAGLAAAEKNLERIDTLQERLYAEGKRSLLIVLQAMDGGGKDGTIDFVFSGINPQGCSVTSFKVPTALELAHDYLWRVHAACPERGQIGIFNRSHYEDVLVTRVKKIIDLPTCKRRYEHIAAFEQMLADSGTVILKFMLHISKDEQKERLVARQQDKTKWWKFNPGDLESRKDWSAYQAAYEDAISATSTEAAPWYVIPADRKWYRNFVVSDLIARALEKMNPQFPKSEDPRKYVVV
jgi:PPK2 family polyphosphate:nucleotide phosphotransferase